MGGIRNGATKKPEIRCELVAQEFGYGEKLAELLAKHPLLLVVKMLLHKVTRSSGHLGMTTIVVKCAFLYCYMRKRVYIDLPGQDAKSKDKQLIGRLVKAMHRARDAPNIWPADEARKGMSKLGFKPSALHPSVFCISSTDCCSVRRRCLLCWPLA